MKKLIWIITGAGRWPVLALVAFSLPFHLAAAQRVETPESWFADGQRAIEQAALLQPNTNGARNVILFIGDGMGITTITAARILEGQLRGESGEENSLSFERLPHSAFSKTYSVDQQTSDSAPTMTAMVTGVKTRDAMLSVNQNAVRGDATTVPGNELPTILEIAKFSGRSVGVVTTTRVTHATPAACYAHTPERDWEDDHDLSAEARAAGFPDIARQFFDAAARGNVDILMGGGRDKFLPEKPSGVTSAGPWGTRLDGCDLIEEWKVKTGGTYVSNRAELEAVTGDKTRLLGLFNPSHMEFEHDRPKSADGEPSLTEMTSKAISILSRNTNGFFLMVEGGRIDHGHHLGNAYRALTETIEFSHAIEAALRQVDLRDTLVIVTADHSHTLTMSGYPKRGNNILGVVTSNHSEHGVLELDQDGLGLPYTTLNYANGPGYTGASSEQSEGFKLYPHEPKAFFGYSTRRPELKTSITSDPDYLQESIHPRKMESHGGEDVAVFADGPSAYLFHGVIEQNVIFHVMLHALHIPPTLIKSRQILSLKQASPLPKRK